MYKLVEDFKLPRYNEIPDIELYMDQLLAYIDTCLASLLDTNNEKLLTTSMVNNYVKQGVIPPTYKKRYSREHIAYLIMICILKQIYSITEISRLISLQNSSFELENAYNYACNELESILKNTFSNLPLDPDSANSTKPERMLVRNSMIAFANKLYIQRLSKEMYCLLPKEK